MHGLWSGSSFCKHIIRHVSSCDENCVAEHLALFKASFGASLRQGIRVSVRYRYLGKIRIRVRNSGSN